jgi:hypothetical protein
VTRGVGGALLRAAAWVCGCPTEGNYVVAAAPKKGQQPGRWWRLWRAAAKRGAATSRVRVAGKKSDSDYYVSGERLPQNWMILLTREGLHR